jgi:hypothetical protein
MAEIPRSVDLTGGAKTIPGSRVGRDTTAQLPIAAMSGHRGPSGASGACVLPAASSPLPGMGMIVRSMLMSIPGIEAIASMWPGAPESTSPHVDAQIASAKDAEKATRAASEAKTRKRDPMVKMIAPPSPADQVGKEHAVRVGDRASGMRSRALLGVCPELHEGPFIIS